MPFFKQYKVIANPYLITGLAGIVILMLFWSFEWIWREYPTRLSDILFKQVYDYFIFLFFIAIIGLLVYN